MIGEHKLNILTFTLTSIVFFPFLLFVAFQQWAIGTKLFFTIFYNLELRDWGRFFFFSFAAEPELERLQVS